MTTASMPGFVTAAEAARLISITEDTFFDWVGDGYIPPARKRAGGVALWHWPSIVRKFQGHRKMDGYVYFVGFASYVKIGFTIGSPQKRIAALQVACPEKLAVYAVLAARQEKEAELHYRFRALRLEGEWFRHENELADYIAGISPGAGS